MMFRGENPANGLTFTVWGRATRRRGDARGKARRGRGRRSVAPAGHDAPRRNDGDLESARPHLPPPPPASGAEEPKAGRVLFWARSRPSRDRTRRRSRSAARCSGAPRVRGAADRRQDAAPTRRARRTRSSTRSGTLLPLYGGAGRARAPRRRTALRARADTFAELQTRMGARSGAGAAGSALFRTLQHRITNPLRLHASRNVGLAGLLFCKPSMKSAT